MLLGPPPGGRIVLLEPPPGGRTVLLGPPPGGRIVLLEPPPGGRIVLLGPPPGGRTVLLGPPPGGRIVLLGPPPGEPDPAETPVGEPPGPVESRVHGTGIRSDLGYGYGGGVMVRVTGGCVTPSRLRGFWSSVMVKGGGRMLLVTCMTEFVTPEVILTFHTSILSVVTGGIVSTICSWFQSQHYHSRPSSEWQDMSLRPSV